MKHTTPRTEQFDIPAGPLDVEARSVSTDLHLITSPAAELCTVRLETEGSSVDLDAAEIRLEEHRLVLDIPPLLDGDAPGFAFQVGRHSVQLGSRIPHSSLVVEVPESCSVGSVTATTKEGDVDLRGILTRAQVETASGDVTLTSPERAMVITRSGDVAVDAAGDLELRTTSGDVEVAHAERLRVQTSSGDVSVRSVDTAQISTASGDVVVHKAQGALAITTAAGDVAVTSAGEGVEVSTASGDAFIGGLRSGAVKVSTASGDLDLAFEPGVPVWTDVSAVSGDVANHLSARGEPAEGQTHVTVVARTVSGDLMLRDA